MSTPNPDSLIPRRKTLVIVDRTLSSGKLARDSLWDELIPSCEMKCISDERDKRESVRINEYDLVIVNWDAANGDLVPGSDDTLLYFLTRAQDRTKTLLHKGGILLCEFQGGMGHLHQVPYDAIFDPAEVQVKHADFSQPETTQHGPTVEVFPAFRNHPIVKGLPQFLDTHYQDDGRRLFNWVGDVRGMYAYKYRASIFWLGWFRWWKKGWIPLLAASLPEDHPECRRWFAPRPAVLLAKCEGNGLLLASTLWIGISRSNELAERICTADIPAIQKFHYYHKLKRIVLDIALPLAVLVFARRVIVPILRIVPWPATIFPIYAPRFRQLIEDFGMTWVFILALIFYLRWIWDRPYGINPFQSFRSALKSLKSFFGN